MVQLGSTLEVRGVEVMELSDLGFFYVSRLIPSHILLEERSALGHETPLKLKACSFVPWREIRTAADVKEGPLAWADVVDFYARHNCDEYTIYPTYRRWTTTGTLPAQAAQDLPSPAQQPAQPAPTPPAQPAP